MKRKVFPRSLLSLVVSGLPLVPPVVLRAADFDRIVEKYQS